MLHCEIRKQGASMSKCKDAKASIKDCACVLHCKSERDQERRKVRKKKIVLVFFCFHEVVVWDWHRVKQRILHNVLEGLLEVPFVF